MSASLHLVHCSARQSGRLLRAMCAAGGVLKGTPGLVAARICFTAEFDRVIGGTPKPTRWGLLCGWETGHARDEFLGETRNLDWFHDDAREPWSVSLDPVRVLKGDAWRGWRPSSAGVQRLAPDEPLVVLTYGKLRLRHAPSFTYNNAKVVRQLEQEPGHLMKVGLADHLLARCTFSLWRSVQDVQRFAYGPGVHQPIQQRSLAVPWTKDYFFARFRPVASTGTWQGRNPITETVPVGTGTES